jgi:hypothetical protein
MINPAGINLVGVELAAKLSPDSQNWGNAWRVAGVGFGIVFLVLTILAVAIWTTGIAVKKIEDRKKAKKAEQKKAS